ncbi:hypothetical protein CKO23_20915 [Thiocystis violacea]|nr:hypothetical protein [Thiocystis violacea]
MCRILDLMDAPEEVACVTLDLRSVFRHRVLRDHFPRDGIDPQRPLLHQAGHQGIEHPLWTARQIGHQIGVVGAFRR